MSIENFKFLRQTSYGIAYVWNLKKYNTNELIYKTEIDPQT